MLCWVLFPFTDHCGPIPMPLDISGRFQVSFWPLYFSFWMLYYACIVILVPHILKVEEVYNFSQDDLLTEDILILDTHAEVFIWIGQMVDTKEKQKAFQIGQVLLFQNISKYSFTIVIDKLLLQSYIEMAASLEGLSPKVPLYKVNEGTEPSFFTTYFLWDNTKAIVCAAIFLFVCQYTFFLFHLTIRKRISSIENLVRCFSCHSFLHLYLTWKKKKESLPWYCQGKIEMW